MFCFTIQVAIAAPLSSETNFKCNTETTEVVRARFIVELAVADFTNNAPQNLFACFIVARCAVRFGKNQPSADGTKISSS